jgi:hypothetical protein
VDPPLYTNDRKFPLRWLKKMAASRFQGKGGRRWEKAEEEKKTIYIKRREEEK